MVTFNSGNTGINGLASVGRGLSPYVAATQSAGLVDGTSQQPVLKTYQEAASEQQETVDAETEKWLRFRGRKGASHRFSDATGFKASGGITSPDREYFVIPQSAAQSWLDERPKEDEYYGGRFGTALEFSAPIGWTPDWKVGEDERYDTGVIPSWGYAEGGVVEEGSGMDNDGPSPEEEELVRAAIFALDPNSPLDEEERAAILEELERVLGEGSIEELIKVIEQKLSGGQQVGNTDTEIAALTPGEMVVPETAQQALGGQQHILDVINATKPPGAPGPKGSVYEGRV